MSSKPLLAVLAAVSIFAPPVYPGAALGTRPAGLADNAKVPPQAKSYSTSDSFAKVKAWYKAHLKGAIELPEPGHETTQDAFLVGQPQHGMVVLIKSFKGKTWIVIGPPT
jgi:hypothetical protein